MIEEIFKKLFNKISDNYIFIYTPPKVGSTTLVSSLRISLGSNYNVIHIHDDVMLHVLSGYNNVTVNDMINYISQKGKKIYIIDVYREPIERKMSEFFEKISCYHFNNTEENINKYSIKRVTDRFNKLFPHLSKEEHYFDKYDISNPPLFDFNKKYTIQILNGIKYIKLRLIDSPMWGKILCEIFNRNIVIINDYQTNNKVIGELYRKFKEEYKIPYNYLELIKNCKYFNFYLSEQERNEYINKWQNRMIDNFTPYTTDEYKLYVSIYLENQIYNDIQFDHYIDSGCECTHCKIKRKNVFIKAHNGEQITEKIIHNEVINETNTKKNDMLLKLITKIKSNNKKNKNNNKFTLYKK